MPIDREVPQPRKHRGGAPTQGPRGQVRPLSVPPDAGCRPFLSLPPTAPLPVRNTNADGFFYVPGDQRVGFGGDVQPESQAELGLPPDPFLLPFHGSDMEPLPAASAHTWRLLAPASPTPPQTHGAPTLPQSMLGHFSVQRSVPAGPGTVMSQNNGTGTMTKRVRRGMGWRSPGDRGGRETGGQGEKSTKAHRHAEERVQRQQEAREKAGREGQAET